MTLRMLHGCRFLAVLKNEFVTSQNAYKQLQLEIKRKVGGSWGPSFCRAWPARFRCHCPASCRRLPLHHSHAPRARRRMRSGAPSGSLSARRS
jgi:hypothetical protein